MTTDTEASVTPKNIVRAASRRMMVPMIAVSGVINVLGLALPIYTMSVFDRVLTSRSEDTLLFLAIAASIAILTSALLDALRTVAFGRIANWITYALSPEVLARSIERRLIENNLRTELLREVGNVRAFLAGPVAASLLDLPWLPLYLVVAFLIHPMFGWLALIGAVLLFALAIVTDRVLKRDVILSSTLGSQAMHDGDSIVRNAEIVDSLGMTRMMIERWSGRMYEELYAAERIQSRTALMLSITRWTRAMIQVALYALAAKLVIDQEMSAGAIIAASIIVSRLLSPVEAVMGQFRALKMARNSYENLNRFFDLPRRPASSLSLPRPVGRLSVDRVSVRLSGQATPTLRNICFDVPAGRQVAIVGPAGSGKTTLARLLIGIAKPELGTVRLDGVDVSSWDREEFGGHVGYLPQDVELFSGTVAENISRFGGDVGGSIVRAARFAGCHEMILGLPKGYETQIGDSGVLLSGGQRQQIGLARAVHGCPRFIVLDEPNSNLDIRGDQALSRALGQLAKAKVTVVIVTHRPSILTSVDYTLILEQGAVRAFGPTADVLAKVRQPAITEKHQPPAGEAASAPSAPQGETVQ